MNITANAYVTIVATSVAIPPSSDGMHPPGQHLVAISLLTAELDAGRWRLASHAHAIPAGEREGVLLEWLADRLPAEGTLIGWGVDHALMPVLLDAAATSAPELAHHFLSRLHRLLRGGVVDLSLEHGGAGAPSLAAVAAQIGIYAPVLDDQLTLSAWATGDVDQLRGGAADEAIALWRMFLRTAAAPGNGAEEATDAWIAPLQRIRAVSSTSSGA